MPMDRDLDYLVTHAATHDFLTRPKQRWEPKADDYKVEASDYFRDGIVFRIWKPGNSAMHLRTFIVGRNKGHFGHCLKIKVYEQEEKRHNFDRYHVKIQKAKEGRAT